MSNPMPADPLEGVALDGRYLVETPIATGGMSTVYRGLDTRLDRPVALKVMDARYAGDNQFLTRFQMEARAVARLSDPGLVALYDQGMDGRHPYLVMELVEGGTLRELLRERGPMPPHAVAAVLRPMLGALAQAHRAGLVHRDIKPENVLISDDGVVKLVDFGLVRAVAEAGITSTSVILGTAAYLSPEQVASGKSDPSSDVYSVGVLTYELLTGTTPFTGDTALAVAYQRMDNDVPAPSSQIDGVPKQFDEFVARATAREPADRYTDASEMNAALDVIAAELDLPPFKVPAPKDSAQHTAATVHHSRVHHQTTTEHPRAPAGAPILPSRKPAGHGRAEQHGSQNQPVRQPTRALTRGPDDWDEPATTADPLGYSSEYDSPARQFAGIELGEFDYARQRARQITVIWFAIVLILTCAVAAAAWSLGSNLTNLLG